MLPFPAGRDPVEPGGPLPPLLRLYTVRQVARILQVTEEAVRKLIFTGKLAASRVGIFVRVAEPSIQAFLDESRCARPDERRDPLRRKRRREAV
ncbi:MAG: helix-turn-helix domain-containing protein [Planctomycetes bacterium]|nr:helix-turn-helix domain-containing protein [Planctomycetota bacterium]